MDQNNTCVSWTNNDPLLIQYHDEVWCVPKHEDNELFAWLVLEGMQAGLSWTTVIHKEAAIREAFDGFDIEKVSKYTDDKIQEMMQNPDIIRNRLKLSGAVKNACAILSVQKEWGSFDAYIWHFTDGRQIIHHFRDFKDMPAEDELSEQISKDMKKRGFSFCGPVIIYSYLQAIGIYDDHLDDCPSKAKNVSFSKDIINV